MNGDKKDDGTETLSDWTSRNSRSVAITRPIDQAQVRRRSEREVSLSESRGEKGSSIADYDWRNGKQSAQHYDDHDPFAKSYDPDADQTCPSITSRMLHKSRLLLVLLVVLAAFCYYLTRTIWPAEEHDLRLTAGFSRQRQGSARLAIGRDYNVAKERVAQLDTSVLPGGAGDEHGKRRLVFVGDIHGCREELLKLLHKIDFDKKTDHLIATGDVISKGPDSAGVIDELIRLGAHSVRGNHEDRILSLAQTFAQPEQQSSAAQSASNLLKELKPHHLDYLRNMPLILRVPRLPLANHSKKKKKTISSEILVVHAGLVPAVPLHKQDPYFVMNMRSVKGTSHTPSDKPASKEAHLLPWVDSWNSYNSRLSKSWHRTERAPETAQLKSSWFDSLFTMFSNRKSRPQPQVVVYGHDSKVGFVKRQWSIGLDSRCVHGGELTALVLDASGHEAFHSIKCDGYAD